MNADHIRRLYDYHFYLNRRLWDKSIATLTSEQYMQKLDYSVGSIRNQTVHMLNIDDRWFSGLRGEDVPEFATYDAYPSREFVRERWDAVEAKMRDYLATLTDAMLEEYPFGDDMAVWEVLIHVVNHGTDHRAQVLAMLHILGAPTFPQDYALMKFGAI